VPKKGKRQTEVEAQPISGKKEMEGNTIRVETRLPDDRQVTPKIGQKKKKNRPNMSEIKDEGGVTGLGKSKERDGTQKMR